MLRSFFPAVGCGLALALATPATAQAPTPLPAGDPNPPPATVPTGQPMPRFVNEGPGAPRGRSDSGDAFSRLRARSRDPAYGYTPDQPIKVGGARERTDQRAILYLNALRGPAGQPIAWVRLGTCCYFTPLTAPTGAIGLLNVYRLSFAGRNEPVLLYLDIYDTEPALVPLGLTARPRR